MSRKAFSILAAIVLLTSCKTLTSITSLKPGKLPSGSSKDPVLVFQLEVIDHTGILNQNSYPYFPIVHFKKLDRYSVTEKIDLPSSIKTNFWTGKTEKPGWEKEKDYYVFKENYFTTAKQGEYMIDNISIFLGATSYRGYNSTTTTYYTQYFYPEFGFNLDNNSLNFLGTIKLEIFKIDGEFPNYVFSSYNLFLDNNQNNIKHLMGKFTETYPGAFEKYNNQGSIVSPHFVYLQDFTQKGYSGRSRDWNDFESETVDYFVYNDKYVLKKKIKDDNYNYMTCNRTFNLPVNFEITWESRLVNGDTEETYGLMIGENPENCFFFYLNGTGTSGIAWLVENEWQNNPAVHTADIDENDIFITKKHRLAGTEENIKYYIDEILIGETGAPVNTEETMLAFFISGKSMAEFDNLFIRGK